jgi:hypothetical protein
MKLPRFLRRRRGGDNTAVYRVPGSGVIYGSPQARENLGRLEKKGEEPFDHKKHKDTKRSQIALIFVRSYVGAVAIIIIGIPLYNWAIGQPKNLEIDTTLAQLGALLGTPLGFVVGYYFKEDND